MGVTMARCVLRGAIPGKLFLAACLLVFAEFHAPLALAQRPIHVGAPPHMAPPRVAPPHLPMPRVSAPPAFHAPIFRPPDGVSFNVPQGPAGFHLGFVPIFHRPFFLFAFRQNFYSLWWLNCGPLWFWDSGCGGLYLYPYGLERYESPLATPLRYEPPVYSYPAGYPADRDLVQLFLTDGTVLSVSDYWFVNDEVHFTIPDGTTKPAEQVMGLDELDLQKTIDVNTRRGFRFVRRDEPMDRWLRDHPNTDPPALQPPSKD